MRFVEASAIAIRALLRNKLRAFLTLLGIVIGISSVLAMIAVGEGATKVLIDDIKKQGGLEVFTFYRPSYIWKGNRRVRNRIPEHFDYGDVLAIREECPSVKVAVPRIATWVGVLMQARDGSHTRGGYNGVDPSYINAMEWDLQEGRFISDEDVENAMKVVVLGDSIAKDLFGEGPVLGEEIKIRRHRTSERFTVIGRLQARGHSFKFGVSWDELVFIPFTTAQQRFTGTDSLRSIIIRANSLEAVDTAIAEAKALIRKRHRNRDEFFTVFQQRAAFSSLSNVSTILKIALGSIAGFSLLVGGIGVMNMMLVAVGERTREIGLRKAMGAKNADILFQFLSESILLCSIGGILGIGLGIFTSQGMSHLAIRIVKVVPSWPAVISVEWALISVLFSGVLGISFGLYPAIKAMRMSPIDALRSE